MDRLSRPDDRRKKTTEEEDSIVEPQLGMHS